MRWLAALFAALLLTTAYHALLASMDEQATDIAQNEAADEAGSVRHDLGSRIDDLETRADDLENRAITRY